MDDLRTLREQREELRGKIDEVMQRNDSIEDIESIELLENGAAQMAQLDTQIRSAEARAKAQEMLDQPTFGFKPEGRAMAPDTEYRFDRDGTEIRVIGGGSAAPDVTFTGDYGASIPVDLQAEMIRQLPVLAPIRSFFTTRQYTNDIELQRVAARVAMTTSANVIAESGAYPQEEAEFERIRFRNFKTAAKSSVTEEFLRDARGRAVAEVLLQHAEEHGRLWDTLYAAGTSSDDGPDPVFLTATQLAVLQSDFGSAAATPIADLNEGTIDKSVMGGTSLADKSAEIVRALTDLRYDKIPAQYWGGLKWLVTQDFFAELSGAVDAFSRPLFQPLAGSTPFADNQAGTMLGLPVTVTNNRNGSSQSADGTVLAVLAHAEDYIIADRTGFSQQVDPYSRGDNGEVVYRTRMRSDGRWVRPFAAGQLIVAP